MVVVKPVELLERRVLLTTFYVDTNNPAASDNNPGTSISAPLKTISQAFDLAENDNAGAQSDTILIRGGVYHEQPFLYPSGGGASATDRTVISAYVNPANGAYEPVYIDAADPTVGAWTQVGTSSIWYLSNFDTKTSGVWVDWSPQNDGASLQQIGTYNAGYFDNRTIVGSGVGDMYPGTYYGDIADSRLYVWLGDGSNPNSHTLEYANRDHAIYEPGELLPDGSGYYYADHVDFIGLNFRHVNVYNTLGQDAGTAIFVYGDERLIDLNIQWSGGTGFFLRGQSEAINCISSNNGQNGALGQGQGFIISGGQYDGNYNRHYLDGGNAAIKVVSDNPLLYGNIENAEIADNYAKGIWFDTCFENDVVSQITGNDIHDNDDAGIDLEASRNFFVANNIITGNQADGISINAVENASIVNNTIVGNYGNAAIELDGDARDQGSVYPGTTGTLNNTIENNIIANNFTVYDLDVPTLAAGDPEVGNNESDYNLFYRWGAALHFTTGGTYLGWGQTPSTLANWQADSGEDAHSIVADPQFLFGGSGASAYQVGVNSPVIGAGVSVSQLTVDYAGNARPISGGYSLGAFEYNGGGKGTAGAVITNTDPNVWVDDQLPNNASMTAPDETGNQGENRFWYWSNTNVYSGAAALDSTVIAGAHRQYFTGADPRLVGTSDTLSAYVWIDPANPVQQIMLEWQDSAGSWAHQAYWGTNLIGAGVDGSAAGQSMGALPAAGQWALLSVPASVVGLAGASIIGFSFDLYDGRALLDTIGNGPTLVANTLNIDSGHYRFGLNIRTDKPDLIVNVAPGASVVFESAPGNGIQSYQLAALNVGAGASVNIEQSDGSADLTVLLLAALSFPNPGASAQGLLDINNNDVIVHNGNVAAINALLATGFAGGAWTGTSGIVSTTAAADVTHLTAVGMATGMTETFDGQAITATDVELKYTYYGDTNLDGAVDGSDYTRIDAGFYTGATGWFNGDFNYDSAVNGDDYTLIDNSFNMQGVSLESSIIAQPVAIFARATIVAGVIHSLIRTDDFPTDPQPLSVAARPAIDAAAIAPMSTASLLKLKMMAPVWSQRMLGSKTKFRSRRSTEWDAACGLANHIAGSAKPLAGNASS
jgi:parallel beta-helix repeat protein